MARNIANTDFVRMATSADLEPVVPCSFGLWIRTTQTGNKVVFENNGNNGFSLQRHNGNYYTIVSGGSVKIRNASTSLNDGNWHRLLFSMAAIAANSKVYVDGVDDTTGTPATFSPTYSSQPLYLGGRAGAFTFIGDLAEAAIWHQDLTADQAAADYGGHVNRLWDDELKYYGKLVGYGSSEADWSGNGNNSDNITGTTAADHAPVGRYAPMPAYRPFKVAAVGGGGTTNPLTLGAVNLLRGKVA